jgi:hypothetical protein
MNPGQPDPFQPVIADLNEDGRPDIAVPVNRGGGGPALIGFYADPSNCTVLPSNIIGIGNGVNAPRGLRAADLTGDGRIDLVTGVFDSGVIDVIVQSSGGSYLSGDAYAAGAGSHFVAAGDVDGDTDHDVAVTNYYDGSVSIFRNDGTGAFADRLDIATGTHPVGVQIGDLNGDGFDDVTVDNSRSHTISVVLSNGDGTFAGPVGYSTGAMPWGHAMSDIDGDGDLDLITANRLSVNDLVTGDHLRGSVTVLRNNGAGHFRHRRDFQSGQNPIHATAADFDGDGRPDIATANTGSNTVSVHLGNANGTFQVMEEYTALTGQRGMTAGDVNCDGHIDIVTTSVASDEVAILINDADWPAPFPPIPYGKGPGGVANIDLGNTEDEVMQALSRRVLYPSCHGACETTDAATARAIGSHTGNLDAQAIKVRRRGEQSGGALVILTEDLAQEVAITVEHP